MNRITHRPLRRFRTVVAAFVAAALAAFIATAPLAGPANAAPRSGAAGKSSGHVQVLSPAAGSVHVARTKAAAAATHLRAKIRVTGPMASVTARLNGHPLRVKGSGRTRTVRLDKADGLRVGQNLLWVSADVRGRKQPAQVADHFVIGYRVSGLLTSSGIQLGGGSAPAAALSLEAPLKGVNQTTATLNGKAVQVPVARLAKDGRRSLDLNLGHLGTFKRGKNTFTLRITMNDGRVQEVHRTFTLDRHRNIAVARLAGSATVGRLVTLDATHSSLMHGGSLAQAGRGSHRSVPVEWTLLTKPTNSTAHLGKVTEGTSGFTPDQPGVYTVGLEVGNGATAGYDVLKVEVTEPDAMVPYDTVATVDGRQGLQVGDDFYPYDKNPIQVVVLDRYTLQKYVWHSYPATPGGVNQMADDWQNWSSPSNFVFVTVMPGSAGLDSDTATDLNTKLQQIGGNLGGNWRFENSTCWQGHTFSCTKYASGTNNTWTLNRLDGNGLSLIGIPGMSAGQAWRATDESVPSARLVGYLTMGVIAETGLADAYVATNGRTDSYASIHTCVDVGSNTCAVTVGDKTYPSTSANGFHVVILDRNSLAEVRNTTVTTVADLHTAINTSTIPDNAYEDQNVVHYVTAGGQSDSKIVIVQSVGDGRLTGTPMAYVWQDLTQLGGTPEALEASTNGSHRYALIGVANDLPWRGSALESSTAMDVGTAPGQPTGTVDGVLQRDRDGLYTPSNGNPAGEINDELYSIVDQPAATWPYANDQALAYIADNINLTEYPDVRSAYVNEGEANTWGTKAVLLQNLTCTDTSLCGPNFAAVKAELLTEFDWVATVRSFIAALEEPYKQSGSAQIFAVQGIYDDIQNAVPPPEPEASSMDWFDLTKDVVGLAGSLDPELEPVAKAFSITGDVLDIVNDSTNLADGSDSDQVVADSADKLATQLATQESAALAGIDNLQDVLLSDYGKLSTLAQKVGGDPDWELTSHTTVDAVSALNASARAQSWTTLMPQTWAATDLEPSPKGSNEQTTNDVTTYQCKEDEYGQPTFKFSKALPQNQFQALSRVEPDGSAMTDVWTFTQKVSSGSPVVPKDSLTDDIYGPTSRGANGAFQYGPSWWRSTYNPPSGIVCYPPNGSGDDWTPPNIPLPLP